MSQPFQEDLAANLTWAALTSTTQGNVNNTWQYPSPSSTSWPFFHLQGYKNEGNLLRLIHMAWELLAE